MGSLKRPRPHKRTKKSKILRQSLLRRKCTSTNIFDDIFTSHSEDLVTGNRSAINDTCATVSNELSSSSTYPAVAEVDVPDVSEFLSPSTLRASYFDHTMSLLKTSEPLILTRTTNLKTYKNEKRHRRNFQCREKVNERGFNAPTELEIDPLLLDTTVKDIQDNVLNLEIEPSEYVEEFNASTIKEEYKCDICNLHCLTAAELSKHEESCNAVLKCAFCYQEFELKSEFSKAHQKLNDGNYYKCGQCHYSYLRKCTLMKHMNRVHGWYLHKCTMCNYQSVFINEVQVHAQSHANEIDKQLGTQDLCNFSSTSTMMNSNMLTESENVEMGESQNALMQSELGCLLLGATSVYETELDIDIKDNVIEPFKDIKDNNLNLQEEPSEYVDEFEYTPKKIYKCYICNYKCYYFNESLDWIIKGHRDSVIRCKTCSFHSLSSVEFIKHEENCENVFKCTLCSEEFELNSDLYKHITKHNKEKEHKCSKCKFSYVRKGDLIKHVDRIHGGVFKCTICTFWSISEDEFKVHTQSHTNNSDQPLNSEFDNNTSSKSSGLSNKPTSTNKEQCMCEKCGKAFATARGLKRHFLTHTGEKPFKCDFCTKEFSSVSGRTKHSFNHSDIKPYCCKVCDYKCTARDRLRGHMRIHTGEKPFKCIICDYQCSYKVSLQNHMQAHTGKQFCCELCDYECSSKCTLKRHIKSHNKN